MGRCQTETYYRTETSYLKSVLLWLQEYWTGPAVRIYPLRTVPQGSLHYNRRDVIIDLPAFLPARDLAAHRRCGCARARSKHPVHPNPIYFFPHFVSSISPIVPPEIVSPSTGLPRKMILVFSWYPFGPNLFQALHGASMRHSLNVLAVQVKVCLSFSSAKLERYLRSILPTQLMR